MCRVMKGALENKYYSIDRELVMEDVLKNTKFLHDNDRVMEGALKQAYDSLRI